MNWKIGLPAAALIVTLMPTGAFSRNHHILDGLSPSSSLSNGSPLGIGGGSSVLSGGTSLLGSHGGSLASGLTNGVASVASPAGTMTHAARGVFRLATNSAVDLDATAPSEASCRTFSGFRSKTAHSCPPRIRRRTMLPPIRPNPTMPSCINPLSLDYASAF